MKKIIFALLLAFGAGTIQAANITSTSENAHVQSVQKKKKTVKRKTTKTAADKFVGNHMLSLQWISWKKFGKAVITKGSEEGVYNIIGRQGTDCCDEYKGRENGDYLSIEGTLRKIDDKHLIFNGTITTRIYHIEGGNECVREGEFHFEATDGRKYWRMQEMENPCDHCVDYVDIYF